MPPRPTMPIIYQLGKLDIRHNSPGSSLDQSGKNVVNVYWGQRWLFSKVPGGFTIVLWKHTLLIRLPSIEVIRHSN